MVIMSLTTLVSNLFIELNKLGEIRKIYFSDIKDFDEVLKEEVRINGYGYISQTNSLYYYELKYGYGMFFEIYEDEKDYVVKLRDNVMISDLENCFRNNIGKSESQCILENILDKFDFNEFYSNIKRK